MKKVVIQEDIFVIEEFLSAEQCDDLIIKSEEIGYEEAKVQTGKEAQTMIKGIRNNDRIIFKDFKLAEELFEKSKPHLIERFENYKVCGLNEMFRFYKYTQGQRFKMHIDGSYERNENEVSFFTFLIYLNDDFVGGATEFKGITTVSPKKGSLLIFHHPYKHEGKELINGIKYCLRSDVMYKVKN